MRASEGCSRTKWRGAKRDSTSVRSPSAFSNAPCHHLLRRIRVAGVDKDDPVGARHPGHHALAQYTVADQPPVWPPQKQVRSNNHIHPAALMKLIKHLLLSRVLASLHLRLKLRQGFSCRGLGRLPGLPLLAIPSQHLGSQWP